MNTANLQLITKQKTHTKKRGYVLSELLISNQHGWFELSFFSLLAK